MSESHARIVTRLRQAAYLGVRLLLGVVGGGLTGALSWTFAYILQRAGLPQSGIATTAAVAAVVGFGVAAGRYVWLARRSPRDETLRTPRGQAAELALIWALCLPVVAAIVFADTFDNGVEWAGMAASAGTAGFFIGLAIFGTPGWPPAIDQEL